MWPQNEISELWWFGFAWRLWHPEAYSWGRKGGTLSWRYPHLPSEADLVGRLSLNQWGALVFHTCAKWWGAARTAGMLLLPHNLQSHNVSTDFQAAFAGEWWGRALTLLLGGSTKVVLCAYGEVLVTSFWWMIDNLLQPGESYHYI